MGAVHQALDEGLTATRLVEPPAPIRPRAGGAPRDPRRWWYCRYRGSIRANPWKDSSSRPRARIGAKRAPTRESGDGRAWNRKWRTRRLARARPERCRRRGGRRGERAVRSSSRGSMASLEHPARRPRERPTRHQERPTWHRERPIRRRWRPSAAAGSASTHRRRSPAVTVTRGHAPHHRRVAPLVMSGDARPSHARRRPVVGGSRSSAAPPWRTG